MEGESKTQTININPKTPFWNREFAPAPNPSTESTDADAEGKSDLLQLLRRAVEVLAGLLRPSDSACRVAGARSVGPKPRKVLLCLDEIRDHVETMVETTRLGIYVGESNHSMVSQVMRNGYRPSTVGPPDLRAWNKLVLTFLFSGLPILVDENPPNQKKGERSGT